MNLNQKKRAVTNSKNVNDKQKLIPQCMLIAGRGTLRVVRRRSQSLPWEAFDKAIMFILDTISRKNMSSISYTSAIPLPYAPLSKIFTQEDIDYQDPNLKIVFSLISFVSL